MQIALDNMARELRVRPNELRIQLGIETQLQKQIRGAKTFFEIAELGLQFREDRSHNSCGPKFEVAEAAEYWQRRAELFPSYLSQFQTIESFTHFGRPVESWRVTTDKEQEKAIIALVGLVKAEILRIMDDPGDRLEKFITLGKTLQKIQQNPRVEADNYGLCSFTEFHELGRKVRSKMLNLLFEEWAQTDGSVQAKVEVFKRFASRLKGTIGLNTEEFRNRTPGLLEGAKSIEEVLLLESGLSGDYLNRDMVEGRLMELLEERMSPLGFKEALEMSHLFRERDKIRFSLCEVYSFALELTAYKAKSANQVRKLFALWEKRRSDYTSSSGHFPDVPPIFEDKWDEFYLERAKTETDPAELSKIMRDSPHNTESRRTAERRLGEHLEELLSKAETEEVVDQVDKYAQSLEYYSLRGSMRKKEIKDKERAQFIQYIWGALGRGETIRDEKKVLIGLYQEYKGHDLAKVREILRLLARYFPAEAVDDVQVPEVLNP